MESSNVCSGSDTLIFACSGAADVGQVADLAAREMTKQGLGKMFCLAGIGAKVEPILKKTAAASKLLAVDGCAMNCVKGCLQNDGFDRFSHLQLGDIGMVKGQTPATNENIEKAVQAGKEELSK